MKKNIFNHVNSSPFMFVLHDHIIANLINRISDFYKFELFKRRDILLLVNHIFDCYFKIFKIILCSSLFLHVTLFAVERLHTCLISMAFWMSPTKAFLTLNDLNIRIMRHFAAAVRFPSWVIWFKFQKKRIEVCSGEELIWFNFLQIFINFKRT